jgi:predicted acyltransferase (DUF342 family)
LQSSKLANVTYDCDPAQCVNNLTEKMMIKMIKTLVLSILVCLLLQLSSANAANYVLPGGIGSKPFKDCSAGPGPDTFTCTEKVDIGKNNTLVITDDVTLNIDGEFKVADDSSVDNNGHVFNVNATTLHIDGSALIVIDNLTATGDVHIHKEANLTANVTSTGGEIKIDGGNNTINGDITANSGDLNIDSGSTVNGTCSPSNSQCTPLPSMVNPTVFSQTTTDTTPIIYGTYSSSVATSLNVTVNSVTYALSSSSELTNSSDNWTLDLSSITPLPLGTYHVTATSADADGSLSDTSNNELVIEEAQWWDTNWTKCRNITIANTGTTTLSNFPAYIDLAYDSDMQSNYYDIRFINTSCANGGFELDFEIETYTASSADVWVEIDNLPAAGTTIAVYYGNASATSGENINGTWVSSHKGVWHLSENTSATNQDSTSNSNNGTPQNSPASTSGKIGKALDFDVGDKTHIDLGTDNSLDLSTGNSPDWTISLWVKPFSDFGDNEYPAMYVYGDYGASVGLSSRYGPDDGRIEHWRNDANALYNNTNLNINAWNHVVVTRDNSTTTFYLNGNANGSDDSVNINQDNSGSFIGGWTDYENGDLKGLIDEVRVSNVVRTPDWIKQSYDLIQDQNNHVTIGDEVEPEPEPELGQCSAIFPDGASTNSVGGTINFEFNSQLFGSDDNQLATTAISKNGGLNTCDTTDCVAAGTPSDTVATVNFQTTTSTINVTVGNNDAKTIGTGTGDLSGYEYKNINGSSEATITFSDAHNEYWVDTLELGFKNTLYLQAGGTYWINQLTLNTDAKIIIQGTGTALIYVNQNLSFPYHGLINSPSIQETGVASKLVMYVLSDVTFNSESTYTGSLYAEGNLILGFDSRVFGAISASDIRLDGESSITYQSSEIAETDFMGMCDVFAPLLDYRFDELSWTGSGNEVIDSSGNNYNGTAIGGITTATGKICNAAQIPNNNSASIYEAVDTGVDLDTVIGSSGTISLWYKGDSDWNSGTDKRLFDANDGDKYFFAEIGSDGRVKFFFEDGNDGDYQKTTNDPLSVGAGVWKHLTFVWDVTNITAKIFVDGIEQNISSGSNNDGGTTALTGLDTLYFGDNRDASYTTGQSSASGLIDEALVFDSVLTATQIQAIFTNQDAGNNWDGTTRSCPVIACGTLNAVSIKIGSGGGSSDSEINTTSEALAIHAAWLTANSPATGSIDTGGDTYNVTATGSSEVDRIDFGGASKDFAGTLPYPGADTGVGDEDFLVHTSGTLSLPAGDYTIYVESDDGFSFVMDTLNGDTVSFSKFGDSSSGTNNELRHENTTGNSDTGGSFTLTQDSVFDISAIFFERGGSDYLEISISNDIRINEAPSGYEILRHGALNEKVKFGQCAVTSQIDHYRIEHDTQGFTCEAETVNIKACADANCDTSYDQETTITLSDLGLAGDGWMGGNVITIPAGTDIPITLSVTDELSVTFSKTSTNPNANLRCFSGSTETCNMTFSDDGFEIYGENTGDTLPDQLAANNFQNVNLRAVRSNNNVCEALLQGTQNIDLTYDCDSPDQCLTSLSGITVTGDGTGGNTGNIEVEFNAQGEASLAILNYPDAGRLILSIQAEVDGVTIKSSDNEAVDVYPSYLQLTVDQSELLYGSSGAQNNYIAGEPFTVLIGAYGVNDALLPNYQAESPQLKVTRIQPASTGSNGHFKYSVTGTISAQLTADFTTATGLSFSAGEHQYTTAYYDEVGRINIDVKDNSYLGNEILSNGSITLGDFYPAYFGVALSATPSLADTCGIFSYIGETITFATNPELTITAYNALNVITENYSDDYWNYLPNESTLEANLSFMDTSTYHLTGTATVIDLGDAPLITNNDNYNGSGTMTITNGRFRYNKVDPVDNRAFSTVSPFDAEISLAFSSHFFSSTFVDQNGNLDTICYQASYSDNTCLEWDIEEVTGTQMRYGRLTLESTYGPEAEPLNVPIKAEYFNNSQWLLNTDDSNCTSIALTETAGQIILTAINGYDLNLVGDVKSAGVLISGVPVGDQFKLKAPDPSQLGPGTQGQLALSLDPTATGIEWPNYLNYDWDGDGFIDIDDFPEATITFGLFRGSDRIIQWREVSN